MKKDFLLLIVAVSPLFFLLASRYNAIPATGFTGMKWNKVQLMLYGNNIGGAQNTSINYPGIKIKKVNKVENSNYLFLDIEIAASVKPGTAKNNLICICHRF